MAQQVEALDLLSKSNDLSLSQIPTIERKNILRESYPLTSTSVL